MFKAVYLFAASYHARHDILLEFFSSCFVLMQSSHADAAFRFYFLIFVLTLDQSPKELWGSTHARFVPVSFPSFDMQPKVVTEGLLIWEH